MDLTNPNALNGGFDPFRDLLANPDSSRPGDLGTVDLRALSPFQRVLLANDGTVLKVLEAYTLEPVESIRLKQESRQLESDHAWLEAPRGTEVVARQVLLHGRHSAATYAYAVSLLVTARLPADLLCNLAVEQRGLGHVLLNSQIENRREILWHGRERVDDLPEEIARLTGNAFISRTYRIIAGGQPIMLINEKFPLHLPNSRNFRTRLSAIVRQADS
ncbi:MAG: chorismate--pyruvate lyase family protein [Gammaproteobacteria bacterium]